MKALLEVVKFNANDIVTTSGGSGCAEYDCPTFGGGTCPGDD